jgi:cytochrome oxidase assembly protein ShyY1
LTRIWPDFWRTARRPRWIAVLVLALGVAAGFAALGQWQLSRSIENAEIVDTDTETAIPLADIAEPRQTVTEDEAGRRVTVEGALVPGDFVVLTGRDQEGASGAWLVGHLRTDDGEELAVALGWTPEPGDAEAAQERAQTLGSRFVGRYLPTESPQESDFEAGERNSLAVAELVNQWVEFDGAVYGGYLVADEPPPGLEAIVAPAPERAIVLNWLNLFYALEWVIFGGFAIYLWYRLVRDAVERERESTGTLN